MAIRDYGKIAKQRLDALYNDDSISKKNKADFKKYMNALDISVSRIAIISQNIIHLFRIMPDVVGKMKDRDYVNTTFKQVKKDMTDSYYEAIKRIGKTFVRWHNDSEIPKGWKDIKQNGKEKRDLEPEDMLTWEDGLALATATPSVQFKAIILMQLDGGLRPSEFIELNYGDISIKKDFAVAKVSGKTGKRDVILFKCIPYLQRWLREHPSKKKDSPLWVTEHKSLSRTRDKEKGLLRYQYFTVLKRIKTLGDKISLKKPLDFYNLRHSACYLSKMDNVDPELASRKFGHSLKYYTETYARMDSDDDIKRYSKHYRLGKEQEETESKPITCIKCNTVNEPLTVVCEQCNNPLTMEEAMKTADEMQSLKDKVDRMEQILHKSGIIEVTPEVAEEMDKYDPNIIEDLNKLPSFEYKKKAKGKA